MLNPWPALVDKGEMDLVGSISGLQAAETMFRVQMAVAAKAMQVSRDQGQMAVDLLTAAMEGIQESMEQMLGDLGTHLDLSA
ncbi:MAG: hypothetical protein GXY55_19675 [Phycisphaerae bacterium]|nr:hypothetical protein [Phycisphaerae bacterium]